MFILTEALGEKKIDMINPSLAIYRCISMFLDAEQSVCHFMCNFAVASPPPKGQGTHFGQQQLQIKKYEYKHIPDHGGDMPKHPPHSKNMGTSGFLAFFKLEDTDL